MDASSSFADPPLRGIRVVEAATNVSAPFAGQMLAHLGAEVVKVETPVGDSLRRFGIRNRGISALFLNVNQGKDAVALDLKDEAGRARLVELADGADVFLQNWRPGVAGRLGLDAETLRARNPRLVYVAVNGFGSNGPKSGIPVFDWLIQAASGVAWWESNGRRPEPMRAFLADKVTASFAAQAVLAALLARERTGEGAALEVAMLDVMSYFNFPDMCQHRTFVEPERPADLPTGRSGFLEAADGYVVVSPVTGAQIKAACAAMGHPEWNAQVRSTATTPSEITDMLFDRLESATRGRTVDECIEAFAAHDVPAGPVLDIDAHLADPQVAHNRIYAESDTPAGRVRRVRHPLRLDGRLLPPTAAAPTTGAEA
ncbi:MAG: CoA transferase [Actinobacteria bacterium]|nr:CoA transferase [Actinomycetota bacterium]